MEPEKHQNLDKTKFITETVMVVPVFWRVIIWALFFAVLLNIFLQVYPSIRHLYQDDQKGLGIKEKGGVTIISESNTTISDVSTTSIANTLRNQETWFTFITPQRDAEVLMPGIPHLLLDEDFYRKEETYGHKLDYVYAYYEEDQKATGFALSRRDYVHEGGEKELVNLADLLKEEIEGRLSDVEAGYELLHSRLLEHGDLKGYSYSVRDKAGHLEIKYVLITGSKLYQLVYLGEKNANYTRIAEKFFSSFKTL